MEYEVGDKVLVKQLTSENFIPFVLIEKYLGTVITVSEVIRRFDSRHIYRAEEVDEDLGFLESDFVGKVYKDKIN